ncbi:MAG TPA: GNAT family N-acetyltransferase [Streptosporangiaceae bacterium]|jgi:GNAT superfamily N-acetyltransferase
MVVVRAATVEEWQVLRNIRLDALRDAPTAFGSTYAKQAAYVETDWRRRIRRGATFFAFASGRDAATPDGLVGGFQEKPETVELVSLWVRPHARGAGVGDALVAAVIDWAGTVNATSVHLWLTEANRHARKLYERCGFRPTDERQPMPANDRLFEVGMLRPL